MDNQKRIDKILEAVEARVAEEIGGLLGVEFTLVGGDNEPATKEVVFEELLGKQICAKMDITGDVSGEGCLLIGIKDAIRLGGTLVMLPASELEEVIGREEYNEEIEDSYGEIANIIAGSFTKDFEEMYPKSCRFVRKEQDTLLPVKVEIESDEPITNQTYYKVVFSMALEGKQMGDLIMLLPAAAFDLRWQEATVGDSADEVQADEPPSEPKLSENVSSVKEDQPVKKPTEIDVEKQKKRIDRLLVECEKRVSDEISSLLGVDVVLTDQRNQFIGKEDFFFEHAAGKQVIADLEVVGDMQDLSYFSVNLKDAIHLGGVLIMLPEAELETVVAEQNFGEDSRDAYGEVANIISGVYTAVFEEQYNESLRFIRKELHEIVSLKVDIQSDTPFSDKRYYVSSMSLTVAGKQLGDVHMLFPVDMLHLESFGDEKSEAAVDDEKSSTGSVSQNKDVDGPETGSVSGPDMQKESKSVNDPGFDVARHKKRVDKLLEACRIKVAEEVSAMLAIEVALENMENRIVSKEDFFFEEVSGKQILANLEITGNLEGKSYLSVGLKDAIRIGGVLIMLPASELEKIIAEETFAEDTEDAYGEIANIISGVYSTIFEEGYTKNVRFVKTELMQISPMKVDIESDEPVQNQDYYLSSMDLMIDGKRLGKVNFLLPAHLMQLDQLSEGDSATSSSADVSKATTTSEKTVSEISPAAGKKEAINHNSIDILLVGDNETEVGKLADALENMGHSVKLLSFQDDVHGYIPGELKAIYLVMQEVNEQAFGAAIKISSSCSLPLIAAGPGWTRSKVIKAMKYGVKDILLTPASQQDIRENVTNNLLKLAA